MDPVELAREGIAAMYLSRFIEDKREGVYYSDIFEQYLFVPDKPSRLLFDWLPDYFTRTPSDTWRLRGEREE